MISVKLGVITEGPTDCIVLDHLIPAYLKENSLTKVSLSLKNLQPFVDNTSKSGYSEGGWEQVYKWCLSNPAPRRRELYLSKPLFAEDMDEGYCDGLLIHLDADICGSIGDKTKITPVPPVGDAPVNRGDFILRVLSEWLGGEQEIEDDKHILVPAVESVEAWLVAGLSDEDDHPEAHPDIQRRLAEINYSRYRGRQAPAEMKRLRKSVDEYKKMAADAAGNVLKIVASCPHFLSMLEKIVKIITAHLPKNEVAVIGAHA